MFYHVFALLHKRTDRDLALTLNGVHATSRSHRIQAPEPLHFHGLVYPQCTMGLGKPCVEYLQWVSCFCSRVWQMCCSHLSTPLSRIEAWSKLRLCSVLTSNRIYEQEMNVPKMTPLRLRDRWYHGLVDLVPHQRLSYRRLQAANFSLDLLMASKHFVVWALVIYD